jgi:hypothetical protein
MCRVRASVSDSSGPGIALCNAPGNPPCLRRCEVHTVSAPLPACIVVLGSSSSSEVELACWHASVQALYTQ